MSAPFDVVVYVATRLRDAELRQTHGIKSFEHYEYLAAAAVLAVHEYEEIKNAH